MRSWWFIPSQECKGRAFHHHHGAMRTISMLIRCGSRKSAARCRRAASCSDRLKVVASRATFAELPDRHAELLRLVGEVLLDAGAGENQAPTGHPLTHTLFALERFSLAVPLPLRLQASL